jgi:3-hydroxyisobutyrate dehydrogenase-like beta-hydroxyacid dehydrogenase
MVTDEALGFIGLGQMGGRMCRNLLRAGYAVAAFDLAPERLAECVAAGATAAASIEAVVQQSEIVLASLPSAGAFVVVAEGTLLPHIRPGQIVIDLGTNTGPGARRLAAQFRAQDAALLDAAVSGGTGGAEAGTLRVFVGGEKAVADRCWPLLEVIGDPQQITYCGPSGTGHVVKGVNQLAMGLGDAAYLEAVAFGVRAGVDAALLERAVGGDSSWRAHFSAIAARVAAGRGENVGVKFGQLHYFEEEAAEQGFVLPLSQALREFCDPGERVVIEANRLSPSYWRELMRAGDTGSSGAGGD